jgi:ATP-dependent Clp protease ATP-binding subunit ClpA
MWGREGRMFAFWKTRITHTPTPFTRYTENAKRTVVGAKHEAHRLGHREIQPEHFLLALLKDSELANGLMKEIAAPEARDKVLAHLPKGEQLPARIDLPLSKTSN